MSVWSRSGLLSRLLLVLLAVAGVLPVRAQTTDDGGTLHLQVKDLEDRPVAGVTMVFSDGDTIRVRTTDAQGWLTLDAISAEVVLLETRNPQGGEVLTPANHAETMHLHLAMGTDRTITMILAGDRHMTFDYHFPGDAPDDSPAVPPPAASSEDSALKTTWFYLRLIAVVVGVPLLIGLWHWVPQVIAYQRRRKGGSERSGGKTGAA
jgi:hypothetical protein